MLSVIDSEIINDFFCSKPADDESTEFEDWLAYRKFIKSKTDLSVTESSNLNPQILKLLTDGRGDTKVELKERPINLHKDIIHYDCKPETFFCFNISDNDHIERIRKKNGYLVGSKKDYLSKYSTLILKDVQNPISVDSTQTDSLKSWDDLKNIILPFTDLIICDSYILADNSLVGSNLLRLWRILDSVNPVRYNFMIITYEGRNIKLNAKDEFKKINEFGKFNNLKGNVGLIITSSKIDKEHDRNIIMNYIRVKSGDSFNFFKLNGELNIKTELDLYSCSYPEKEKATKKIINRISKIALKARDNKGIVQSCGNMDNRLLD